MSDHAFDFGNTPASFARPDFQYRPLDPASRPCVTIVTPFHDSGPVFLETARSIFRQSFQAWEWIIVDDGSTDAASLALLDAQGRDDPRIRVIRHQTNRGLSAARNTGFRAAATPYVFLIDSDDLIEPTAIEKCYWFLESHPEAAFAKGYTVGFGAREYLWTRGFHEGEAFLGANLVTSTAMIRTAVHRTVGGYDEDNRDGMEDWDFWLRCASAGYWGGTVHEYLDWYRRKATHGDQWANWDHGKRERAFGRRLRERYAPLVRGRFPGNSRVADGDDGADRSPAGENRLRKERRRLLMIVPWLEVGGADKFNLDLARQLIARGWEITVATTLPANDAWHAPFAALTPDIFMLHRFLHPEHYPRFLRYLVESRQADAVLLSHSELAYGLLPWLRASCPGAAFIDYGHIVAEDWKNGGYPRLSLDAQGQLDLSAVSCRQVRSWMVERGADPERVEVCTINVDVSRWKPDADIRRRVRGHLGISESLPVILYAGRLCPQKQPDVFARVMKSLHDEGREFHALVAGDGDEKASLEKLVSRLRLTRCVRLLGAVSNDEVRDLMTASDILFLPSQSEGISLAIYEAMACELVVVGADVGGQRELVPEDCGRLLAPGDKDSEVAAYTRALAELLDDPEERTRMGRLARQRVSECFALDAMGDRMAALLERAGALRGQAPRAPVDPAVAAACIGPALESLMCSLSFGRPGGATSGLPAGARLRVVLHYTGKRCYEFGKRRGWPGMETAREFVQHVLVRWGGRDR